MAEPREQEQSIKDRKKLLYDDDPTPASAVKGIGKPFTLHLRETQAAPLPMALMAGLWLAGIVVALLLAGAAWKASQPRAKPEPEKVKKAEQGRSAILQVAIRDR